MQEVGELYLSIFNSAFWLTGLLCKVARIKMGRCFLFDPLIIYEPFRDQCVFVSSYSLQSNE